jgi:Ca-activated chloride channel family protein
MFCHSTKGGEDTVTMETKISGESKTYKCKMDFPEEDTDNPELERLWALAQIEMHEDMVNQGLQPESEKADFIRNIGLKYQLVTDETSMIILDADAHNRHSIERRNQERVRKERQAQSQRMAAPIKNYRVDAPRQTATASEQNPNQSNQIPQQPRKRHHDHGMFQIPAPRLGGGGGALDPWMLLLMGGFVAAAVCLPERKRK